MTVLLLLGRCRLEARQSHSTGINDVIGIRRPTPRNGIAVTNIGAGRLNRLMRWEPDCRRSRARPTSKHYRNFTTLRRVDNTPLRLQLSRRRASQPSPASATAPRRCSTSFHFTLLLLLSPLSLGRDSAAESRRRLQRPWFFIIASRARRLRTRDRLTCE